MKNLVILTGAGISAESGVPTFRGSDGLWEGHRIEDVASPEGFARNPALVQQFYNLRRAHLSKVEPNAAHLALAELERQWPGKFLLVTQNVDDLHERAGSQRLIHLHGELKKARCLACRQVLDWSLDLASESICLACNTVGRLRPHIVWFGEMPLEMDVIFAALEHADLFIAIGTSGQVYPAAGFVEVAAQAGARTIEANLEAASNSPLFEEQRIGPATRIIPELVAELLAASPK
ncbi:MAG: NAD-dependent protein deacylase [Chthoniobacteraceae bacterium]